MALFLLEASWENLFLAFSSFLEAAYIPWLVASFSHHFSLYICHYISYSDSTSIILSLSLSSLNLLPLFKDICDYIRTPDNKI